jgi:hypothetical protein
MAQLIRTDAGDTTHFLVLILLGSLFQGRQRLTGS